MKKNEFIRHNQMTKFSNDINLNDLSNGAGGERGHVIKGGPLICNEPFFPCLDEQRAASW